MAEVQGALNQARVDATIYPPPAFGGPVLSGLSNTAFAHEDRYHRQPTFELVLRASARRRLLEQQERDEARRRQSFLYWPDRVLSAVLGFPVYLLSKIVGVPQDRIERSPFAGALRILGLVIEGLGVFFGGRAAGWW
jgi:hypothetical protein